MDGVPGLYFVFRVFGGNVLAFNGPDRGRELDAFLRRGFVNDFSALHPASGFHCSASFNGAWL